MNLLDATFHLLKEYTATVHPLEANVRYSLGLEAYQDLLQMVGCIIRAQGKFGDEKTDLLMKAWNSLDNFYIKCGLMKELNLLNKEQEENIFQLSEKLKNILMFNE